MTSRQSLQYPAFRNAGFFIALILSFTSGCTQSTDEIKKKVVVRVNNIELHAEEFAQRLAARLQQHDAISAKAASSTRRAKNVVIRKFILEAIAKIWAKKHNILVEKPELKQEIQNLQEQYPDKVAFREALAAENITMRQWKERVRRRLLQEAITDKLWEKRQPLSDDKLRTYYESHKEEFERPKQVKLQQVVTKERSDALRIKKLLEKGQSFSELAKKFSTAPEAQKGGRLGWVDYGTLGVFDKTFNLPEGRISDILESPYGYHILKVLDKKDAHVQPFTGVKKKIRRQLKEAKEQKLYSKWLEKQLRQVNVYKNKQLISSIEIQTRGK